MEIWDEETIRGYEKYLELEKKRLKEWMVSLEVLLKDKAWAEKQIRRHTEIIKELKEDLEDQAKLRGEQ